MPTGVRVVRVVGRRYPRRLGYWWAGTACRVVVPLAWVTVFIVASEPEWAGWAPAVLPLLVFTAPGMGWLLFAAAWTTVLALMTR
jgi:hypothetical protein